MPVVFSMFEIIWCLCSVRSTFITLALGLPTTTTTTLRKTSKLKLIIIFTFKMQLTGGVEIHFDAFLQCDQIGQFLKVFVNKFANKSSPQLLVTFGLF